MPFYKWIIQTEDTPEIQEEKNYENPKISTPDASVEANKRMVRVIRHISQLARIADDVFGGIDFECRKLFHRTCDLNKRIYACQEVVDNLNAKTVKVPVSTLTGNQVPRTPFLRSDAQDLEHPHIFNTYPRPPEVERLRSLANGPSPAAHIPCSETDGQAVESISATHIYCQPLQIPDRRKSRNNGNVESKEKTDRAMTSAVEVPSNVVPIDVSGQSFARMSTFRKSLIYMDSLLGRKKKDKRRNTVTEGESKDLKDALQNIINKEAPFTEAPKKTSPKHCASNGVHKTFLKDKNHKNSSIEETNNNSTIKVVGVDADILISPKKFDSQSGHNKTPTSHNSSLKPSSGSSEVGKTLSIKKPRSHIPISTNSAAMNVAVEMRQLNGIEEQSSSCSDHTLSDSDNRKKGDQDPRAVNGEDSGFSDSYKAYKNRSSDPCKVSNTKKIRENDDIEPASSASSENNTIQDDASSSNDTTVESDAFYLSSDDSDEGSSDIFEQKYGSSISLSTISDGSLNSLLSQTGTEMASSTGTLTSIGFESLPTPPPPPCIIVASNNEISTDVTPEISPKNTSSSKCSSSKSPAKNATSSKPNSKVTTPQKHAKSLNNEKCKTKKSSADNSKGIFTSLVSKKSRSKEKSKPRDIELKMSAIQPINFIDMYGNNSPQTISRIPVFVKENSLPLSEDEPKTQLQSFLPRGSRCKLEVEHESGNNSTYSQSYKEAHAVEETSPPSKENILSDVASPENVQIPLKYVQQVVVTPISRQPSIENSARNSCRKTLFKNDELKQRIENDVEYKNINHVRNNCTEASVRENYSGKPQRPNTLLTGSKPIARVVLDPEGRVKYSTNSLDRCLPYSYHSPSAISNVDNQPRYAVSPQRRNDVGISCNNPNYALHNSLQYSNQAYIPQESTNLNEHNSISNDYNSCRNQAHISCKEFPKVSEFHPHYPSQLNCQSFHPNSGMQTKKIVESRESYCSRPLDSYHNRKALPTYEEALSQRYPSVIVSSPPDPNVSGLPNTDTMLTEQNVNLHSQNMEQLSRLGHETVPSGYSSQSPSQANSKGLSLCKSQGSTMSTEDLFAVIHDCKKRLNIKTDSDISLASSSRSNSPSCLRPPQSRGSFVETGFLSPRNSAADASRDRRSWADFRPSSSTTNERKSLASDRLGRSKPTSMHDFKLLLLQARSSTQPPGPRKSAVEMLKIPSSPNGTVSSPSATSSRYSNSFSAQSSPTSPSFIHSGHSTVPFKRHNSRVRSSLQSRYTMYPPIFEDCSEEAENVKPFD